MEGATFPRNGKYIGCGQYHLSMHSLILSLMQWWPRKRTTESHTCLAK